MTEEVKGDAVKAVDDGSGATAADAATAPRLRPLPLPPPPGKFRARGHLAVFGERIFVGAADRILAAEPGDKIWSVAFEPEKRTLTEPAAEIAQALGMVQDAAAAAAMGVQLPGAFGFGPFAVFHGSSDRKPCLYCAMSSVFGGGILRSADAKTLKLVGMPGVGDPSRTAWGALARAGDWLVTAVSPLMAEQTPRGPAVAPEHVRILASRDPASGIFEDATEPGFAADVRGGVTALASAHGKIYAAVQDADRGFHLWRADPAETLPWRWEKVIDRGGHGFSLASTVTRMAEFDGALYVAAGISESGFGKDFAGPGAAELLRVHADGRWDLVIGHPRFSPDGLKVPLSGIGPGFGGGYQTLITGLAVHDGVLLAGTRNCESEFRIRRAKEGETPVMAGGAALWSSTDGESWRCIFTDGDGNPALTAVRSLWSGEDALFAAMAINPQVLAYQVGMGATGPASDEIEVWKSD